jgi:hypothetical protein
VLFKSARKWNRILILCLLYNGKYIVLEHLSHFVFRTTKTTITKNIIIVVVFVVVAVMIVTITTIIAMIHIFQTIRFITVPQYDAVLEPYMYGAGKSRL